MIVSVLTVLMMTGAALGGGLAVLRFLGPSDDVDPLVRLASAFVLGIGVVGWLGFFFALSGLLGPVWLLIMLSVPLLGLLCWGAGTTQAAIAAFREGGTSRILLAILALVLLLNLLEGLAPPIDADSLAYHFALPKQFLQEGHLVFVPRALDGAIPLLLQMTYMAALGIGGELALTLWAMVSGWAAAAMLFAVVRSYVGGRWALPAALLFMTTPAVIYGAGSGQVEVRNAAFLLVAAFWVLSAAKARHAGAAVLAGLAIGFFIGSKYTGLLSLAVLGVALLVRGRDLRLAVSFGVAALAAGSQWYAWNWWNIGDPLFPSLYGIINYPAGAPWSAAADTFFRSYLTAAEKVIPVSFVNLFVYPFLATLAPNPVFESLRAGFGPLILLVLPPALAGAWASRNKAFHSDLLFYVGVCFAAYALWFLFGPSQRLRHLLPLYPLLILVVAIAAIRTAALWPDLKTPLVAAMALTLVIQIGGQGLFSLKYVQRLAAGESRSSFLTRMIPGFAVVTWADQALASDDRLMVVHARQILYLFDIPVFMAHPIDQAEIELRPDNTDPSILWRQMRAKGITHILGDESVLIAGLRAAGCLETMRTFSVRALESRTLPAMGSQNQTWIAYHLMPGRCAFAKKAVATP